MLKCFDTGHFEVMGGFVYVVFILNVICCLQSIVFLFFWRRADILARFQLVLDRFDLPFMAFLHAILEYWRGASDSPWKGYTNKSILTYERWDEQASHNLSAQQRLSTHVLDSFFS